MKIMSEFGVGFIGAGFIARFLASSWTGIRGADINAIYNIREKGAKDLASYIQDLDMRRPEVYTDIHEMLSDDSVDGVWILTPNFKRVEIVKKIVEEANQGRNDLVGVCCEKPLARTVGEAEYLVNLIEGSGLLHGYLENQIFSPSVTRGKGIIWEHGTKGSERPYLARAAEEHGGPHSSWFWDPRLSGGGVLLDMSCHSLEVDRYLLTDPEQPKKTLKPRYVQCTLASLKWTKEPYVSQLRDNYGVDYNNVPAEDYSLTGVTYEDENGSMCFSEARTSWCYSGPGLRLSIEVLGPEYSMSINSLKQELEVFFSRELDIPPSEEFIEKQGAEHGLIPLIPDEALSYGYQAENRHMVKSFLNDQMPIENWYDGLLMTQLMMTAYKSAEEERTLDFNPASLRGYKPSIAKGEWRP